MSHCQRALAVVVPLVTVTVVVVDFGIIVLFLRIFVSSSVEPCEGRFTVLFEVFCSLLLSSPSSLTLALPSFTRATATATASRFSARRMICAVAAISLRFLFPKRSQLFPHPTLPPGPSSRAHGWLDSSYGRCGAASDFLSRNLHSGPTCHGPQRAVERQGKARQSKGS